MSVFVWRGWRNFAFPVLDLGLYNRHMWGLVRLDFSANPLKGFNLLGDHSHFILFLIAPIYAVFQTPVTLLVVQILCISLSGWPIYLLTRKYFRSTSIAALWLVPYYIYFGFWTALAYPFHVSAVVVLPLAWALYFLLERKYTLLIPILILLVLVKEDMPLVAIMIGLYMIIFQKKYKLGVLVAGISGLYFIFVLKYWLPTVSKIRYYYTDTEVPLSAAITNPFKFIQAFFSTRQKSDTIWSMILSYAGLPLIGLEILVLLLPIWAGRFLSVQGWRWSFEQHYSANQGPILAVAAIIGVVRLINFANRYFDIKLRQKQIIFVVFGLVCIVSSLLVWKNFDLRNTITQKVISAKSSPAVDSARLALSKIPPGASVGVQSAFPQATSRKNVYNLPLDLSKKTPDYLILSDSLDTWSFGGKEKMLSFMSYARSVGYNIVYSQNGVYLLKR